MISNSLAHSGWASSPAAEQPHSAESFSRVLQPLWPLPKDQPNFVREVHFRANLGPSYVTATTAQIDSTVNEFLHSDEVTANPRGLTPRPPVRGTTMSMSPKPCAVGAS